MADWKDWSEGWLQEGYYISYVRDGVRYYEHIIARDLLHWVYEWPETINPENESGPYVPDELEITKGYDPVTGRNHIWQVIFGIRGQVYIYVELPTDIHRHGLPKAPKPGTAVRTVSHFEEWMSPFHEPSFVTEHFMMRPDTQRIAFSAYNPNAISITPYLNIFVNSLVTERLGWEERGTVQAANERWREILERLYRRTVPHRPLTLYPVRMPAEAPAGQ